MDPNSEFASLDNVNLRELIDSLEKDPTGASGKYTAQQLADAAKLGDIKLTGQVEVPGKGMSLGRLSNIGMGLYQGGKAIGGLMNNSNTQNDLDALKRDINAAKVSNPMYDTYLDANQEKMLRQLSNNTYNDATFDDAMKGVSKGIPSALLATLFGGLTGGVPGAIIFSNCVNSFS